jgi:type I restriction enzyme, S subunit
MVNSNLPDGWKLTTLGEVTHINPRDVALRTLPDDLAVTFLPMSAVDAWQGIIARPEIRPLRSVRKGFTAFSDGDVLLAKITPSMENGKAAIAKNLQNGIGFGSTEFHVFRPKEDVTANWIFHFIRQEDFRKDAKAHFAGTAGQLRVPASFLVNYPIPIAPLPEQERIVAKIEELFTQLEAGTSALAKVQAGLRRYKASVLKAAVSGKLVNSNSVIDEGELPQGWQSVRWGQLISIAQNGFGKRRSASGNPTIVLRLADIIDKDISLENVRRIGATDDEIKKYELLENDLICIRVNGSLNNVGRMVLFRHANEAVTFCDHFIRFRLKEPEMAPFFSMYFDTDQARKFVELNRVSSAGQNTISQGTLLDFEVPLPPLEEQRQIVAEVERRLSVAWEVESAVDEALVRASRLRQAVLKSAFEGRLA